MEFIKYIEDSYGNHKYYDYKDAFSAGMCILGDFLTDDVGNRPSSFREWLFDHSTSYASSNATCLAKEGGYVLLSDLYSEEEDPTELKMTNAQFLKLLDDWEEKVIKVKPKEVVIKYENDKFVFE